MHPLIQKYLPQQLLSKLLGALAASNITWLKNILIKIFISKYPVNLQEATITNPFAYQTFNHFFTRTIQPKLRPIVPGTNTIASPVDGTIWEIAKTHKQQLISAKKQTFTISELLGPKIEHSLFQNGAYINIYLSPTDYHRVHMPITGTLLQMNYIPGKLFSVNNHTANYFPNLFANNERVVTIFLTEFGPMAVILVGAMIVGSIETVWAGTVNQGHNNQAITTTYSTNTTQAIQLIKGQELGLFKFGSTVIILFANNNICWEQQATPNTKVLMGQALGALPTTN